MSQRQYRGVTVSIPSKVRGAEAEDEWQEVDWVNSSTGDLSVDGDAFLLVFKATSGATGSVAPKQLGTLLRASGVGESAQTLMVTTSDAMYKLVRCSFASLEDVQNFEQLAEAAEAFQTALEAKAARRAAGGSFAEDLEGVVAKAYQGCWPMIFGGVELYGPDSKGGEGAEVLLGRGVAALLDPTGGSNVGNYSLSFFDEDNGEKPVATFAIAPTTALTAAAPDKHDVRPSAGFEFRQYNNASPKHMIRFEDSDRAAEFERDLRVRMRLMVLSSKTVKGKQAEATAKSELDQFRRSTAVARMKRLVSFIVVLVVLSAVARLVHLTVEEHRRGVKPGVAGLRKHALTVAGEMSHGARFTLDAGSSVGRWACTASNYCVTGTELKTCLYETGLSDSQALACVKKLVPAKR